MSNCISILGSTGSIGTQTLQVAKNLGIRVNSISAGSNYLMLEKQAREFRPEFVALYDEKAADELRIRLSDTDIKVYSGEDGLIEVATDEKTDTLVTAVVGTVGLKPTLAAITERKRIALANKETLVCAGDMVIRYAQKCGALIVPVDSEHSAIFQSLLCRKNNDKIKKILLTCSGGPFREASFDYINNATKNEVMKHPTWNMGAKITTDSATLMNKGLEFIEAMHLFKVSPQQIQVVIHPESVVHSAVEYEDNSIIAQLGSHDMKIPIQYALTYPNRKPGIADELNLFEVGKFTFYRPDYEKFPCLKLAMELAEKGGNLCAAMNAANEKAVALFLNDKIRFNQIFERVNEAVEKIGFISNPSLEDILNTDREARRLVTK